MTTKDEILQAIAKAEKLKLDEQHHYRQIISAALATPAIDTDDLQSLAQSDWNEFLNQMADENWPATHKDLEHIGLSWDQFLIHQQLKSIADEEVRYALYTFSDICDQTERLKSAAKFYTIIQSSSDMADLTLLCWSKVQSIHHIQRYLSV